MIQAIEKAHANGEDGVFIMKDDSMYYGRVWTVNNTFVGIMTRYGTVAEIYTTAIKSFARCDNRYTV